MRLKTNNLKFIIKGIAIGTLLIGFNSNVKAQEVIVTDSTAIQPKVEEVEVKEEPAEFQRYKVDGIAAVVGAYVVLESDVDLMYKDLKSQGVSTEDITDCQLAGSLLENKLYAHHAIQDSILVSDAEVRNYVDQQITQMVGQVGSMQKVLNFYKRDSEDDFRNELFELNKQQELSKRMQQSIIEKVEITPEEIRSFFDNMAAEERPRFGDEVEISQIIIKPEVPETEKQKVIDRLKQFREDIVDNGASFGTKAVLYSQDPGSSSDGGRMVITRKDGLDKDFKDTAFSLQEGEVSEPFASQFGYHIIQVEKVIGQNLEIRHILLIPDVTNATVESAKAEVDSLRAKILNKEITFGAAAKQFSDEEQTAANNGKLINPTNGDTRFELTKIDPELYEQVVNLNEGDVSLVLRDQERTGKTFYKIITVNKRYKAHDAEFVQDYMKIKELALKDKQLEAIGEWQNEKIANTYIKINGKFRNCTFDRDWLKK
jgi:peptidyl-prolyl cis-trans isomerase SurA